MEQMSNNYSKSGRRLNGCRACRPAYVSFPVQSRRTSHWVSRIRPIPIVKHTENVNSFIRMDVFSLFAFLFGERADCPDRAGGWDSFGAGNNMFARVRAQLALT